MNPEAFYGPACVLASGARISTRVTARKLHVNPQRKIDCSSCGAEDEHDRKTFADPGKKMGATQKPPTAEPLGQVTVADRLKKHARMPRFNVKSWRRKRLRLKVRKNMVPVRCIVLKRARGKISWATKLLKLDWKR